MNRRVQNAQLRRVVGLASLVLVGGSSSPAFAYRDASTLLGAVEPVAMPSSAIAFAIESNDGGMASSLRQEANRALAGWSAPECSSLSGLLGEVTIASGAAIEGDGINTIEWVEQDWTAHCAIESSLGCTKVQYVQGTDGAWHIDEADDHSRPLSYLCAAADPIGEGVPRDVHG